MTRRNDSGQSIPYSVANGGLGRSSLTAYGLLMGDSTNPYKQIGTGNAGDTVIGQGAGADSIWAATKNQGLIPLIQQQTVSAAANIDFTNLSSSMLAYLLVIDSYDCASNSLIYLRFSSNNGSSFISTSNYHYSGVDYTAGATGAASQAQILLSQTIGSTAAQANSFDVLILNPNVTNTFNGVLYKGKYRTNSGTYVGQEGMGCLSTSVAVNAFRIFPSTGNIDAATFSLYGLQA